VSLANGADVTGVQELLPDFLPARNVGGSQLAAKRPCPSTTGARRTTGTFGTKNRALQDFHHVFWQFF
jgi:hypothetical protein